MDAELIQCIKDWLKEFHPKFSDIADLQSMRDSLSNRLPTYRGTLKKTTEELIELIDERLKELTS